MVSSSALESVEFLENLLPANPYLVVVREVSPAHRSCVVDQEFGRAGDVCSLSASLVEEVVASDHVSLWIGKEGKCVTLFGGKGLGYFGRIDAHRDDPTRRELRKFLLQAPQLGVAVRSPVTSIENEKDP